MCNVLEYNFSRAKNFNVDLPAVVALRRGKYLLPESELFQQTARTAFNRGNIGQFISKAQVSVVRVVATLLICSCGSDALIFVD